MLDSFFGQLVSGIIPLIIQLLLSLFFGTGV